MEDIIEIYEPIFRESFNYRPIIIAIISVILVVLTFLIIKKIRNRKLVVTPEQQYKNVLDSYIKLQTEIEDISSHDFSHSVTNIFKGYLTKFYSHDFKSTTATEMIAKMNSENSKRDEILEDYFLNSLEPAQFGKVELDSSTKNEIVKECVDYITIIYNQTGDEDA